MFSSVSVSVETRVKRMKEKSNQMLKDLDNSYNMLLIKIPKAVRQMNWLELYSELARTHTHTHRPQTLYPCYHLTLVSIVTLFFLSVLCRV